MIERGYFIVFIIFVAILANLPGGYSQQGLNFGHEGNDLVANVGARDISLQQSLTNGELNGTISPGQAYASILINGHFADEIWIKVNGTEKTLQSAINNGSLCCDLCDGVPSTYSSHQTGLWHYGDEIMIINRAGIRKTLQSAIDNREFCSEMIVPPVHGNFIAEIPALSEGGYLFYRDDGVYDGVWRRVITAYMCTLPNSTYCNALPDKMLMYSSNWDDGGFTTSPFIAFNTSLPYGATINSAKLVLSGAPASFRTDPYLGTFFVCYKNWGPVLNNLDRVTCINEYVAGNYSSIGSIRGIDAPLWTSSGTNNFSLSRTNNINKTGDTYFTIYHLYIAAGPFPGTSYNTLNFYSGNYSDVSKRPKIIINYSV